jgi:RimJ/RimL family protein N-acetyltransferase
VKRHVAPVTLEGRDFRLEPLTLSHADRLWRAANGPRDSYAWTFVPADAESTRRYVEEALAEQEAARALPFATIRRANGEVVGSTRFGNIEFWTWPASRGDRRDPDLPDAVEIGWTWLAAQAQRTSVNTEAKLLMLTHAFETWRVHRVTLKTDVRNARSRLAIERLGARLDGILRAHLPASDGSIRDSACYSILAREWPALEAALRAKLAAHERSG